MGEQGAHVGISPAVTFVVLSWNECELTLDCLASLYKQTYPSFTVVVVDNGSHDGSVAAIRAAYPDVAVIENARNMGVAAANNQGIRYAMNAGSDYVFLLNNDTMLDPHMLEQLVSAAESDESIGMTAPAMLYFDRPEIIWCGGNSIDWRTGNTIRRYDGQKIDSVRDLNPEDVDFITSCSVCIKRQVFESVGLMDERYFIYYDETDFFVRASTRGWRAVFVPQARMWHKVSATMGEGSPRTDYYMSRNRFLFLAKHLRGFRRVMALTRAALANSRVIAAHTVKNRHGARLRNRDAKVLGMRDALLGRWGELGEDVAIALDRPRR